MNTPYVYWNNRGDFKKEPRWCAIGINYAHHWTVNSNGVVMRKARDYEYRYILGKEKPRYPVPAIRKIDPLIYYHILRDIYRWLWRD